MNPDRHEYKRLPIHLQSQRTKWLLFLMLEVFVTSSHLCILSQGRNHLSLAASEREWDLCLCKSYEDTNQKVFYQFGTARAKHQRPSIVYQMVSPPIRRVRKQSTKTEIVRRIFSQGKWFGDSSFKNQVVPTSQTGVHLIKIQLTFIMSNRRSSVYCEHFTSSLYSNTVLNMRAHCK